MGESYVGESLSNRNQHPEVLQETVYTQLQKRKQENKQTLR